MKITVEQGKIAEHVTEALVVALCESEKGLIYGPKWPDKSVQNLIKEVMATGDFTGEANQVAVLYTRGAMRPRRIVLTGLGKKSELDQEKLRNASAKAAQQIRQLKIKQFAVAVAWDDLDLPPEVVAEAVVEGVYLGLYQFTPFKTQEREKIQEVEACVLLVEREVSMPTVKKAAEIAATICRAVCFARDLVSMPGNMMTPSDLAQEAKALAAVRKKVHVKIIDAEGMKKLGMNALLGVASGSCQPPQFIILEYRGGRKGEAPIALVGKGLTFDSGGISLKPSEKMEEMKTDMAGGAAVMGAIMAAADLPLPINVLGMIPATENLPGGKAYKPGDILTSMSGITIEVTNTDAEGRIILADALTYAGSYKPTAIIDIATLTGACVIALGENVSAILGTDENLKENLKAAAENTAERVWELPFWEEYQESLKSEIADFKNAGGRAAGTITAAVFLSKFVGAYPWAHLDIAGAAWRAKEKPYIPKGASGVGVRLFVRFLRDLVKEKQLAEGVKVRE